MKFGNITTTAIAATATQLNVVIPAGAQSAPILISVDGNNITSLDSFTVIPIQQEPSISGFAPSIIGVGYPVTITGTNFSADSAQNSVTINGVPAKLVSSSITQLVATVPLQQLQEESW